jgi:glycosyltransferase involved in cell wall biosynthesis
LVTGTLRLPFERRAVTRAVESLSADVFHVQFKREQIGLTDLLGRYAPVVWTEHGRFTTTREGLLIAAGYRRAARRATLILCVSDVVAEDVAAVVGGAAKVRVVPNAVDTAALRPASEDERRKARKQLGLAPEDGPVLAWVGQLHPGKLPLLAVDVGQRFSGTTLIAGDGPLAAEVSAASRASRVRYLGYREDPTSVYRAADALLFTSAGHNEGYPTNSMLEGAAHGLQIIANRRAAADAVVAFAGGTIADDDPAELARCAERAAALGHSSIARAWAESHDMRKWVRRHEGLLREAMQAQYPPSE